MTALGSPHDAPSTGLDREYAVRVNKKLEDNEIAQLKAGVEIEGEMMRFSDIRFYNGSESNFGITWLCWRAGIVRCGVCSIARAARSAVLSECATGPSFYRRG